MPINSSLVLYTYPHLNLNQFAINEVVNLCSGAGPCLHHTSNNLSSYTWSNHSVLRFFNPPSFPSYHILLLFPHMPSFPLPSSPYPFLFNRVHKSLTSHSRCYNQLGWKTRLRWNPIFSIFSQTSRRNCEPSNQLPFLKKKKAFQGIPVCLFLV